MVNRNRRKNLLQSNVLHSRVNTKKPFIVKTKELFYLVFSKLILKRLFFILFVPKLVIFYIFVKRFNLRVLAKKILREFWEKHTDCEQQLKAWYSETEHANWETPNQIKAEYPSASVLIDNRVVFNIKGNTYRLIVKINYEYQMVWIRFIGTHTEYDKINANTI